jgi:hypothetical protein
LAIVSLEGLVQVLAQSPTEAPDGFVIENYTAGGHNANPMGALQRTKLVSPSGEKDIADLDAIRKIGLPFWLAGGYGSPRNCRRRSRQVQRACRWDRSLLWRKNQECARTFAAILNELRNGLDDESLVRTTMVSPTGFAFKVVQLPATLSERQSLRRGACLRYRAAAAGTQQDGEDGRGLSSTLQPVLLTPTSKGVGLKGTPRNASACAMVYLHVWAWDKYGGDWDSQPKNLPLSPSATILMVFGDFRGRVRCVTGQRMW